MDDFRIMPPIQRSPIETDLNDDLFCRRAKSEAQRIAANMQCETIGAMITSARGLSIFRCNIIPYDENEGSYGVLVYWEDQNRQRDSAIYLGETLELHPRP